MRLPTRSSFWAALGAAFFYAAPTLALTSVTVTVNGDARTFDYVKPSDCGKRAVFPVVFVFHGGGQRAEQAAAMSGFHLLGRSACFITVYPQGSGRRGSESWNDLSDPAQGWAARKHIDEVAFVRAMLAHLASRAVLKRSQSLGPVFATGISKGGMLAYALACQMSEIRAIAPVAATLNTPDCRLARADLAILHLHGLEDQNVPLLGGSGICTAEGRTYPAVQDGLQRLAAQGAEIELVTLPNQGHSWPGMNPDDARNDCQRPINPWPATWEIWRFFKAHSGTL